VVAIPIIHPPIAITFMEAMQIATYQILHISLRPREYVDGLSVVVVDFMTMRYSPEIATQSADLQLCTNCMLTNICNCSTLVERSPLPATLPQRQQDACADYNIE
jgi:hypothetical protein